LAPIVGRIAANKIAMLLEPPDNIGMVSGCYRNRAFPDAWWAEDGYGLRRWFKDRAKKRADFRIPAET
jgi:hypothetical protein